jgi:hypothetical protein
LQKLKSNQSLLLNKKESKTSLGAAASNTELPEKQFSLPKLVDKVSKAAEEDVQKSKSDLVDSQPLPKKERSKSSLAVLKGNASAASLQQLSNKEHSKSSLGGQKGDASAASLAAEVPSM